MYQSMMKKNNVYILEDRGLLYISGDDSKEFLQNLKVDTDAIKFTFRIVNYTVCGESQHMKSHVHGSDFKNILPAVSTVISPYAD